MTADTAHPHRPALPAFALLFVVAAHAAVDPAQNFGRHEDTELVLDDAATRPRVFETVGEELEDVSKRATQNTQNLLKLQAQIIALKAKVDLQAVQQSIPAKRWRIVGGREPLRAPTASVGVHGDRHGALAVFSGSMPKHELLAKLRVAARDPRTTTITVVSKDPLALPLLGATLDAFLAESFEWLLESEPSPDDDGRGFGGGQFNFVRDTRAGHAEFLRSLQAIQYPVDGCANHGSVVSNDIGAFFGCMWDGMAHVFHGAAAHSEVYHPMADSYGMHNGRPAKGDNANQKTHFWMLAGKPFCGDAVTNKWECYFLPVTSCPLPKEWEASRHAPGAKRMYQTFEYGPADKAGARKLKQRGNHLDHECRKGCTHQLKIPPSARRDMQGGGRNTDLWPRTMLTMLLTRLNFHSRARLRAQKRQYFATEGKGWNKSDNCVTVHMRRGDKLADLSTLTDKRDPRFQQRKVFAESFGDYMNQAKELLEKLPGGGKTVFVMTDDATYLAAHKGKHPDLSIYGLGSNGQPGAKDDKGPTADAFDLFLSQRLAARCGGFVGNFQSNISAKTFQVMCYLRGTCPKYTNNDGRSKAFPNGNDWRALSGR